MSRSQARGVVEKALGSDEIRALCVPSNAEGALALLTDYGLIALALAFVGVLPHPLTIVVAVVVLGGRQLALAVLMHEASHRTLFRTRWLNDAVARWLCAAPIWQDLERYRRQHLAHHAFTGTERDPDLCLVEPFPTSRASLARKVLRDLLGLSAVRRSVATLLMDFELLPYSSSGAQRRAEVREPGWWRRGIARTGRFAVTQLALLALLAALGQAWLYLVWLAAFFTTFSLFVRVRAIAEHAATERGDDPFRNTRTTHASWLARLTVAPHSVNHHLEHHLLVGVPFFRLARVHAMLAERDVLTGAHLEPSYLAALRRATEITGT